MATTLFDTPVRSEVTELKENLGSPSSASAVTGADAFSKISTLDSKIENLIIEQTNGSTISQKIIYAIQNASNFIVLVGYGGAGDSKYALTLFIPKLALTSETRYFQVSDSYNTGVIAHLQVNVSLTNAVNVGLYRGANEDSNASYKVFYC